MENKHSTLALIAILATIGSLAYLGYTQFGGRKMSLQPLETVGEMVARETAALLNHSGPVVVVMGSTEGIPMPGLESQMKGFKAGLAKTRGVTLKGVRQFQLPEGESGQQWPPGQAERLLSFGEGAAALVLFVNLPQTLSPEDLAVLKEAKSKVVFVSGFTPAVKPVLLQGGARLVIVNRFPPPLPPAGAETPEQWFKRLYIAAKPDALGELP